MPPISVVNDSLQTRKLSVLDILSVLSGPIELDEIATPGTPDAGKVRLYAKSDGRLYIRDDTGSEVQLDPAGAAVLKSLYDAYSLVVANVNDTPIALPLAAGEVPGRARSGGNVIALSAADILDLLGTAAAPVPMSGYWYDGQFPSGNGTTSPSAFALTADRLYAFPFWFPLLQSWAKIGVEVTTLEAGKNMKLGIYARGSDGLPGTRLYGSPSDISLGSTGSKEETVSLATNAGWFYVALRSDSAGVAVLTRRATGITGSAGLVLFGSPDTASLGNNYVYSDSGTYAADGMPATFPSSPTLAVASIMPRVMLKI